MKPTFEALNGRLRAAFATIARASVAREVLPLVLVAALLPWLWSAAHNYRLATLFRDANMFSYAAYCFRKGLRMYDDFATPDGPLIYVIQAFIQIVAGTSAYALRTGDLVVQWMFGAVATALVVPRAQDRFHDVVRRATWATVGGSVWIAQMLTFPNPDTLQRESYYVGIGCVAIALAYASGQWGRRPALGMLALAGFLSGLEPFGKHTGLVYPALVVLTTLLVRSDVMTWRKRVVIVLAGASAGAVLMLLLIAVDGSFKGFWFWYFRYNFEVYRFQRIIEYVDLLSGGGGGGKEYFVTAGVALIAGLGALRARVVPPAIAAFAVGPMLHVGAAIAQRRGWHYHYIPVQASAHLCFVVLMATAWCLPPTTLTAPWRELIAIVTFVFFGARIQQMMVGAAFVEKRERNEKGLDETLPLEAGEWLATHSRSTDRVFYYGGDPVVLFAAQRLPATPYIVAWLLDYRLSLDKHGDDDDLTVTPAQKDNILELQTTAQADACLRLTRDKPPELVFMTMEHIGLGTTPVEDVEKFCPQLREMLPRDYHLGTTIGRHQIFLRNDRD